MPQLVYALERRLAHLVLCCNPPKPAAPCGPHVYPGWGMLTPKRRLGERKFKPD
jgi:hypothetical protein